MAINRNEKYLYYIFMDDGIDLKTRSQYKLAGNPWRLFENFLGQIEPAVGAVTPTKIIRLEEAKKYH